ncbi:hypothetical protein [Geminicoccus roseus]|uniref:hypothetical protein n=1 Tax=Geminicoccus roseus TaxID=404900 RepID=UPI000409EB54|nr:hypothetical protein [Geminicoccus roseus]
MDRNAGEEVRAIALLAGKTALRVAAMEVETKGQGRLLDGGRLIVRRKLFASPRLDPHACPAPAPRPWISPH